MGRPADYLPEFCVAARKLCDMGATDPDLGEAFDVTSRTITRWRIHHPEFAEACKLGKSAFDDRIETTLAQRCVGYTVIEQQAIKVKKTVFGDNGKRLSEEETVEVVEVEKHVPADTATGQWWLANRRGDKWRNRQDHHHSGSVDHRHTTPDDARDVIRKYKKTGPGKDLPTQH